MATLEGLHPTIARPRFEAFLADPDARRLGLYLVSGFRSVEYQRALWLAAVNRYRSVAEARKWVAPPGTSNHGPRYEGYGLAADIGVPGIKAAAGDWPDAVEDEVNRIAARYGLASPMAWEDWHFEPTTREPYTAPVHRPPTGAPLMAGIKAVPGGAGTIAVEPDGGVFTFDGAEFFDSLPGLGIKPNAPVVDVVVPDRTSYYLVSADGGVFAFGPSARDVDVYRRLVDEYATSGIRIVGADRWLDAGGTCIGIVARAAVIDPASGAGLYRLAFL